MITGYFSDDLWPDEQVGPGPNKIIPPPMPKFKKTGVNMCFILSIKSYFLSHKETFFFCIYCENESASSLVNDLDPYIIIKSYKVLFSVDFQYSYAGGKFSYNYTGRFFHKVSCTWYDIPWFVELMDLRNFRLILWW
jgi:hypothetical protein